MVRIRALPPAAARSNPPRPRPALLLLLRPSHSTHRRNQWQLPLLVGGGGSEPSVARPVEVGAPDNLLFEAGVVLCGATPKPTHQHTLAV